MDRGFLHTNKALIFVVTLCLFFSAVALGSDETVAVEQSVLLGVRLPSGALRVNDAHVPTEISQTMQKLVAEGGGKVRQGSTEVLVWTGNAVSKVGSKNIVSRLTDTLRTDAWQYEVGGTEKGITFFSLLRDGATRRAVVGFFGEADNTFIFATTELYAAAASKTESSSVASSGNVSEYQFVVPAGWSRNDSSSKIVLSKDGDKTVTFLPPVPSSGDLERDAERFVWHAFKGSNGWSGNGFEPDWGIFEKGKTSQGLEYFRAYRYGKSVNDSNESNPDSRFDAIIVVIKLGDKVAVIAGRQPFQSDYARNSAIDAIDTILYDLTFDGIKNSYNAKSDLLGSWSAASGSVGLAYTFNVNGTFNKGGAVQFRTSRDAYTDNVTTTSYGMSDTYTVAGTVLTQNYKRTGQVMKYKMRFFQTKYNKDAWQQKVGFLPAANPESGTIVMRRSS